MQGGFFPEVVLIIFKIISQLPPAISKSENLYY